jgi:photosystem II stability/assembly factor-like uncharacterized protein
MKRRHAYILLAVLLLSAVFVPYPAQADTAALEWTSVDKPGTSGNIVVTPSEVSEIAIGNDSVLYAIDSENSEVYRSLNAGRSWEDITRWLVDAGAELPAGKIAVAPDKPDIVAAVTNDGSEVYLSTDGGATWTDARVPSLAGTIQAITISREYTETGESFREIAIGTAVWGDNATTGQIWVLRLGESWPSWQNQNLIIDPSYTGGEVSALAYSPDYGNDKTILAVASTSSDVAAAYQSRTWLCLGERDTAAGTTSWNTLAGYPVEIIPDGDAPGVSFLHSSLALPSDYSSEEALSRQLFVSCDREPDADDDVYWLDDTTTHRMNADGGSAINISSISYYGTVTSGKLLAGDANPVAGSLTVQVRRTSDPFDPSPTWQLSSVPPTGPGNAKVSWSPDGKIAYCGTGQSPGEELDESAFSRSLDGDKWRQLGLMDTTINLADIAPAPDSESLFVTTNSPFGPEGVWRSAGDPLGRYWERVLAMDTTTNAVILRLSASYSDDSTMYAAEAGGNLMAVSYNRGNTWQWCKAPGPVIDMVVVDENTVYVALPDGYVSKTTDAAWSWQDPVDTGLSEINMLAIAGNGTILVGGRNGAVAYSTDGGDTFIKITESIGSGDVQVVADAGYGENDIIYAATNATDEGIWRWSIGFSDGWEQIDKPITELEEGQRIAGLVVGSEGTLYALRSEPANDSSGGVTRSLNPLAPIRSEVEFDLVNYGLPVGTVFDPTKVFPNTLPYLKLSEDADQNELWTIDTANQLIYRFQDTLCKIGPSLDTPEDGAVIPIDPCACDYITSLFLHWAELSGTETYQASIYFDPECTQSVWSGSSNSTDIMAVGGTSLTKLVSGTTYYWRVRSTKPINSPWSATWSFAPALGDVQGSALATSVGITPSAGAANVPIRPAFTWSPVSGATGYEFMLAKDSEFTDVVVAMTGADALPTTTWACDRDLDYSTTYFWKVRPISATTYGQWVTNVFSTEAASSSSILPHESSPSPSLLWIVIGIGVALITALLVLTVRKRG